jgi:eukaryotic-like serine/threonine-protein kinase
MDAERWKQVDDLLQSALLQPSDRREDFLRHACAGDNELEQEVRSLLTSHRKAGSFLEDPAIKIAAQTIALTETQETSDALLGRTVSHYRVLGKLGSGGMGAVYEAEDLRLGRHVALKVLLDSQASDRKALLRFEHEARAICSLNHPNICTLYEVEDYEGKPVIVMELLEGQTLEQRMKVDRIPLSQLVQWGIEVADALDAAHAAGLVHRDIKPANLFITTRGRAKVLDFGLAKLTATAPVISPLVQEDALTSLGVIPGTTPYMSPEQVRGDDLDGRTDLFSLGAVLYEMATGKRPFAEKNVVLTMNAVLNKRPGSLAQVSPELPAELERIVEKALEKDLDLRYQSAADLLTDLSRLKSDTDSGRVTAGRSGTGALHEAAATGGAKLWKIVAPVLLVATLTAAALYYRSHQTKSLTDKDTIVLADFTNTTGDAVFDDTLKQGLSIQLKQSPFLALISDRRVNETLKLMGRPAGDRLTPEVTREVCLRTGSKAMLSGSIANLGSQYVLGLKAVNCNTGDVLAEAQEQAAGKEAVLKALGIGAVSLRSKLGESLSSVQKYATPLREATTPSLEALKAYSLGHKTWSATGGTAALPFFKQAVELDPSFAEAYASISATYANLNEAGRAAEYSRKAFELREKVSEMERFAIETNYYEVEGELEKAAQVSELWAQTYPRDSRPVRELGFMYSYLGNHEKALEQARQALLMGPHSDIYYSSLGIDYTNLNRLDEAEAVYKQAEERKMQSEMLLASRYQLAFLRSDMSQMSQIAATAMGRPGTEDLLLAAQADTEAWHGKLQDARELTKRAMDAAERNDARETAATYQSSAALREVESGNRQQARTAVHAAMKLATNRDVRDMAALVLARAGDTTEAERLATELEKTFPLDTLVQRYWLPTIRAAVALHRKDPDRAIELLKAAGPIELGASRALQVVLCPVYLRGEAYLMLHDGSRATGEFQKFLDHRGLVGNFPWGSLARLGLARAYALDAAKGSVARDKARTAYQEFLAQWKDADPDIPILKQAKLEYGKLN